jgi:hypothetical protein
MKAEPSCPRCGASLRPPGLWSSSWQCELHGAVHPLHVLSRPGPEALDHVVARARVPVWLPWPLPAGWVVTGLGYAGDDRSGGRATVVACSGPSPVGGPGDLVLVAEEPGVGLGARYAGLAGPDPGAGFDLGPPHAKVEAAGHPTPLWSVDAGPDVAVYVGEAKGLWLWAVLWPAGTGMLLLEDFLLRDLRDGGPDLDPPYGAPTPRLTAR